MVIYNDFMEARFDETTSDMLQLFSSLDEQIIACRNFDGYTFACISCPNMQARVARSPMNGQKIEIGMESSQDGIFLAILDQIRGSRSQ